MLDQHLTSDGVCVRAHRPAVLGGVASHAIENVVAAADVGAIDNRPPAPRVMLDERLRYNRLTNSRLSVLTDGPAIARACTRYGAEDAKTEAFVRGTDDLPVIPVYAKMRAREPAPAPVEPTAQHSLSDAQVTPNRRPRWPTFGTVAMLQPLPLYCSIPTSLTAQQSLGPAQDTASGAALLTMRQLPPVYRSIPAVPTAQQLLASAQDTPESALWPPPPGVGLRTTLQPLPEFCSMSGSVPPVSVRYAPTAQQSCGPTQVTAPKLSAVPALGLSTIVQSLPEFCSISVRVFVPVSYVPTAMQTEIEAQATALNVVGNPRMSLGGSLVRGLLDDDEPDGPPHAANRSPTATNAEATCRLRPTRSLLAAEGAALRQFGIERTVVRPTPNVNGLAAVLPFSNVLSSPNVRSIISECRSCEGRSQSFSPGLEIGVLAPPGSL